MRRALFSLDHSVEINGVAMHRLGPLILDALTTRAVLLIGRVLVYILATAALIQAFEFPCPAEVDSGAICNPAFKSFHLAIYFIVVTLSTVGFGDVYAATTAGRMIMIGIILIAIINVPALVADFGSLAEQLEERRQKKDQHPEAWSRMRVKAVRAIKARPLIQLNQAALMMAAQ